LPGYENIANATTFEQFTALIESGKLTQEQAKELWNLYDKMVKSSESLSEINDQMFSSLFKYFEELEQ
jgi:hypothetical protein